MNNPSSILATIDRYVQTGKPFAVLKKEKTDDVILASGDVCDLEHLADIPRTPGVVSNQSTYDTISMVPFSQARERGMETVQDDCTIRCMQITEQMRVPIAALLDAIPQGAVLCEQEPALDCSDEEYAAEVRKVIEEQIHRGNASNVVISAGISGKIAEMTPQKALTICANLLRQEFGAYMTFFFYDGKQYHIGASPERHITVDHGEVTMNPISGTYRKINFKIDPQAFKEFLQNPKEINELFMCMDEEMKQMAQMCEEGGKIVGPLLKEMSGLVHTEYLLIGRSEKDCIDLLRTSMHAPTVTGSPAEPAFDIIKNTERVSRGYYAGELLLMGHHPDGSEFLDSAIAIRTMQILPNGLIAMRVGASIVRDSIKEEETAEIKAKAGGAIRSLRPADTVPVRHLPLVMNEELEAALFERNAHLNTFLFENQDAANHRVPELQGKTVTIIDFQDQFSYVLRHMVNATGAVARVVRFDQYDEATDAADIVIIGPGPGDPRDEEDVKMKTLGKITSSLLNQKKQFLSICLGHQKLCEQLGIELQLKDEPSQGVQRTIDLFGNESRLGFYNTFAGFYDKAIDGIDVSADADTQEVFAVRGSHFSGFQFHPESIMSEHGFPILVTELKRILAAK